MPELRVKNLSFLGRGPYDFVVKPGTIMCIYGESGSGKSLLLRAIADLEPQEGEILLGNVDYKAFTGPQWRKKVSYLSAENCWWHETPSEHFCNPPSENDLTKLSLNTSILEQSVNNLSTGEKQRLALLRTFANKPEVILLDEPTANLDIDSAKLVEKMIIDYISQSKNCALWISHNVSDMANFSSCQMQIFPGGTYKLHQ